MQLNSCVSCEVCSKHLLTIVQRLIHFRVAVKFIVGHEACDVDKDDRLDPLSCTEWPVSTNEGITELQPVTA